MKKTCKLLMFLTILSGFSVLMPFTLSAEEPDTTERAAAEEEEEEDIFGESGLSKPANTWPKGNYALVYSSSKLHLGPTGLWGASAGQNVWVNRVVPGSPADGKVLPGDIIYGVDGKVFPADRSASYYFANAITKAETKEAGGKLNLDIRRDGKFIQVTIPLKVMGSFSSTTPYNCEKSENIVSMAEEYMIRGLRPKTGLPKDGKYMYAPWNDSVLFLLATGNPECQGLVRRYIREKVDELQASMDGDRKIFNTRIRYNGWGIAYLSMLFGEYYHRTGDPTVLPYYEALVNGTVMKKNPSKMDYSWPPTKPGGYGTHPAAQMPEVMGMLMANEAGLKVDKEKLRYDLKYLYHKRAEYGYVKYMGYGDIPYVKRQADAPLEITEENKTEGTFSSMNGKLGTAAALYSMVGHEKTVETCAIRCVYAFNNTSRGHGGVWFNGFWTPIGAYHAGPEKFTTFMKGQQWWRELYRDHTGSMWQTGNAKGHKEDSLGTGFAIHRALPRKMLRMFGAPRSMFGPDAPAYIKEAQAAHRNRDYALAEQLTLKLIADGTVPAQDKNRVNHFLDSVRTLRESVEYDLTFTEKLLKEGNYALASIELPQLQMVVSPNNPRLKAIVKALQSTQAQAHIASVEAQARKDAEEANAERAAASTGPSNKEEFEKSLESIVTLVKDGWTYKGPQFGRRGRTYYPKFSSGENSRWRMKQMKTLEEAPEGWELPGFDDSTWKPRTLPIGYKGRKWDRHTYGLFRTEFEVKDPSVFKTLRIRGTARKHQSMTVYLNGELVAMVVPTKNVRFDLKPEALKLLKKGKNTLAASAYRGQKPHAFGFRLEGLLQSPEE